MKHTTDGTGNFILSWIWEFQKEHQTMGWSYWLIYNEEKEAKDFLENYVKKHFNNVDYQIKQYTGTIDYFTKFPIEEPKA